jgi:hypothetical protein
MALQQINGNQISTSTNAIISTLSFLNTNSVFQLPSGTQLQRPTGVSYGTLRFNTTQDKVEVYVTNSDGQGTDGWIFVGAGGPHIGTKDTSYIYTNSNSIDETLTIGPTTNGGAQYTNGFVVGPVEIATGYTITVETGASFYILGDGPDDYTYENVNVYGLLDTTRGRIDASAIRESIQTYRLATTDTMVNIDYNSGSIIQLTNVTNNFDINILNLPVTNIALGGNDANRAFGFTVLWNNGSTIQRRPTANIYVNGSLVTTAKWFGGAAPTTLTASRDVVLGLTLMRVTEYTDGSGGSTTSWKAYLQFNEFG